jgi:hypothetical protein
VASILGAQLAAHVNLSGIFVAVAVAIAPGIPQGAARANDCVW